MSASSDKNTKNKKKTMKHLISLTMTATLLLSSCIIRVNDEVALDGKRDTKTTTLLGGADGTTAEVQPYDGITSMGGCFDVYYTQGAGDSLRFVGPKYMIDRMEVTRKGSRIVLQCKDVKSGGSDRYIRIGNSHSDDIKVYATSRSIKNIEVVGSGDFEALSPITTDRLNISISGSGDIDLRTVTASLVRAEIAGSGDMEMTVRNADLDVSIAGSGDVDAKLVDGGAVRAKIAGSGDIRLTGNVQQISSSVSGSGDINASGLAVARK